MFSIIMRAKNDVFEKAFFEVKVYIKEKDFRAKISKREVSFAKQEFLAEVKESAKKWFNKRVKEKDWLY